MQNLSLRFLNTMGQYSLNLKRLGRFSLTEERHNVTHTQSVQQTAAHTLITGNEQEELADAEVCLQNVCLFIVGIYFPYGLNPAQTIIQIRADIYSCLPLLRMHLFSLSLAAVLCELNTSYKVQVRWMRTLLKCSRQKSKHQTFSINTSFTFSFTHRTAFMKQQKPSLCKSHQYSELIHKLYFDWSCKSWWFQNNYNSKPKLLPKMTKSFNVKRNLICIQIQSFIVLKTVIFDANLNSFVFQI